MGKRSRDEWIEQYSQSHQHPLNRACHFLGIPLIVIALALFAVSAMLDAYWLIPVSLFVLGWALQFLGHWIEGKPPEFFKDWRFLLVGLSWWVSKVLRRPPRP